MAAQPWLLEIIDTVNNSTNNKNSNYFGFDGIPGLVRIRWLEILGSPAPTSSLTRPPRPPHQPVPSFMLALVSRIYTNRLPHLRWSQCFFSRFELFLFAIRIKSLFLSYCHKRSPFPQGSFTTIYQL